jgi:hypothetical protein
MTPELAVSLIGLTLLIVWKLVSIVKATWRRRKHSKQNRDVAAQTEEPSAAEAQVPVEPSTTMNLVDFVFGDVLSAEYICQNAQQLLPMIGELLNQALVTNRIVIATTHTRTRIVFGPEIKLTFKEITDKTPNQAISIPRRMRSESTSHYYKRRHELDVGNSKLCCVKFEGGRVRRSLPVRYHTSFFPMSVLEVQLLGSQEDQQVTRLLMIGRWNLKSTPETPFTTLKNPDEDEDECWDSLELQPSVSTHSEKASTENKTDQPSWSKKSNGGFGQPRIRPTPQPTPPSSSKPEEEPKHKSSHRRASTEPKRPRLRRKEQSYRSTPVAEHKSKSSTTPVNNRAHNRPQRGRRPPKSRFPEEGGFGDPNFGDSTKEPETSCRFERRTANNDRTRERKKVPRKREPRNDQMMKKAKRNGSVDKKGQRQ